MEHTKRNEEVMEKLERYLERNPELKIVIPSIDGHSGDTEVTQDYIYEWFAFRRERDSKAKITVRWA